MLCVYLLRCSDNSLYCGMTKCLSRRLEAHRSGRGSRYVRSRLPVSVAWVCYVAGTVGDALKLKHSIKKMSKRAKEQLVLEY